MKRTLGIALAAAALFAVTACGSAPAAGPAAAPQREARGVPAAVMPYIINAPEGAIVGIGTARFPTISMSMQMAQSRALTHIATQLGTFAQNMVTDYMAASEVTQDAIGFSETVSRQLTEQTVEGASTAVIDEDAAGNWWAVLILDRARATTTVQEAMHNLNPSFAAAMGGLDRMDRAFEALNAAPLVPIGD